MKKKNVLFLLTDDQRYNTVHAANCEQIKTPNIDKLVEEGTYFDNAYIEGGSGAAVCMPSRAMINSSKYLYHLDKRGGTINEGTTCMAEQFKNCGYETFGTGKWHNGPPAYARSFTKGDRIFFGGMWDHWNVPINHYDKTGKYDNTIKFVTNFGYTNEVSEMRADEVLSGRHSTDIISESLMSYLDEYGKSDKEKPFFAYCAFLAPHDPRTMPDEFKNMYNPEDIDLPENFLKEHPFNFGVEGIRDEILTGYPREEKEVKRHLAEYYGMISHVDARIGEIIEKLREIGELENTVIVLTGDNGLALGSHGLMGKQNLYEHSIKVPLVIKGPDIPQGERREQPLYLLDIYPTLCDICGLPIPKSVEGKSFKTELDDKNAPSQREAMYYCYTDLIRAVNEDGFKLIEYRNYANETQLFNLNNDPMELHDLSKDDNYKDKLNHLKELLKTLSATYESDDPQCKKFWDNY